MSFHNVYLAYKRDQKFLTFWVINAGNAIFHRTGEGQLNTTGQITLSLIKETCKLVAKHLDHVTVPDTVYRLLRSTIDGRKALNGIYNDMAAISPDDEMKKGNETHQAMIDTLEAAFRILGGKYWEERKCTESSALIEDDDDVLQQKLSTNMFAVLGDTETAADSDSELHADHTATQGTTIGHDRYLPRKGKRKARVKKNAGKGRTTRSGITDNATDVSLNSCQIIEDDQSIEADYTLAVFGLVNHWCHLRSFTQSSWREVIYHELNSAVAATIPHLAIASTRRTEAAIFVNFPGRENYEDLVSVLTELQTTGTRGEFVLANMRMVSAETSGLFGEPISGLDLDEVFLVHTYEHLQEFLVDFQKSMSGKPTKSMLKSLRGWDANTDLSRLAKDQCLEWRRCYTIRFLYDLITVDATKSDADYQKKRGLDGCRNRHWSEQGIGNGDQQMIQTFQFAAVMARLAHERPERNSTSGRKQWKTPPYLLFELQCVADSACIARGWIMASARKHFTLPPPSKPFRAERDVDVLLKRQPNSRTSGLLQEMERTETWLMPLYQEAALDIHRLRESLSTNFGCSIDPEESPDLSPITTNSLLNSSPYIRGIQLAEALDLMYRCATGLFQKLPEPLILAHLYNILVKKGYISTPHRFFEGFVKTFTRTLFGNENLEHVIELEEGRFSHLLQSHTTMTERRGSIDLTLPFQSSFLGISSQFEMGH